MSYLFGVRDDYFTAIERTLGTRFTLDYEATHWVNFFTRSLQTHVQELVAMLTDWHRKMEDIYATLELKGFDLAQADAYVFAIQTGQITRADYVEITGFSQVTASRHLADFVRQGFLKPEGRGRNRAYRPVPLESQPIYSSPEEQLRLLNEQEN